MIRAFIFNEANQLQNNLVCNNYIIMFQRKASFKRKPSLTVTKRKPSLTVTKRKPSLTYYQKEAFLKLKRPAPNIRGGSFNIV